MGKLLKFPGFRSRKGAKGDESTIQTLRDVASYVENKATSKSSDLQEFLSNSLLDLMKQEQLRNIEKAIDEVPEEAKIFSDFLVIRRFLLAYIVHQASLSKPRNRKILEAKLGETIEGLANASAMREWDWVSFNEQEYELFTALANLANDSTIVYILNKARPTYLRSSLTMSEKFWNMQEAVNFYELIVKHVLAKEADIAKQTFLDYYEKNDQKILFHYKELKGN